MPATGAEIARRLGVATFDPALLYLPDTSVAFGTQYVAEQLRRFNGNAWVAAAAYNAGPGGAARWVGDGQLDSDAYAERITFAETKLYVRQVGRYFELYRLAYRPPG
jgi:soluble lytic murein transglycosylase